MSSATDWKQEHDKVEQERWAEIVENRNLRELIRQKNVRIAQLEEIEGLRLKNDIKPADELVISKVPQETWSMTEKPITIQASLMARRGGPHDCKIIVDRNDKNNPLILMCEGKRDIWVENSRIV